MEDSLKLTYADYRNKALNCDIGLQRPSKWNMGGRLIAAGTNGPYCHAFAIQWWEDRLMACEYTLRGGGHAVPLSTLVRKYAVDIDVFRVKGELDLQQRQVISTTLRDKLGDRYASENIIVLALVNAPVLRWLSNTKTFKHWRERVLSNTTGAICSAYIADSFDDHNITFMRKRPELISPNDLYYSSTLESFCSLK